MREISELGQLPDKAQNVMPLNEASTLAQSQNAPASDSFQMQQDYRKKALHVPCRASTAIQSW